MADQESKEEKKVKEIIETIESLPTDPNLTPRSKVFSKLSYKIK